MQLPDPAPLMDNWQKVQRNSNWKDLEYIFKCLREGCPLVRYGPANGVKYKAQRYCCQCCMHGEKHGPHCRLIQYLSLRDWVRRHRAILQVKDEQIDDDEKEEPEADEDEGGDDGQSPDGKGGKGIVKAVRSRPASSGSAGSGKGKPMTQAERQAEPQRELRKCPLCEYVSSIPMHRIPPGFPPMMPRPPIMCWKCDEGILNPEDSQSSDVSQQNKSQSGFAQVQSAKWICPDCEKPLDYAPMWVMCLQHSSKRSMVEWSCS